MADPHPIPDEALDSDIAILGRKGGGKTYTSKGIVERLLDLGRRVLILDPLGVWAGLRTAADGASPGYPIAIFGGQHADLPLDPAAAVPLARIIAAENLPAIIDLSDLSKSAQQSFLNAFLHELRRVNTDALTLVLEEADVFAPQNPQGDDSKQLHSEIDWIARRGRFKGFRLITITQRPARLSKDVLTQANLLILHRLPAPQDRDAAKAWVEGNGDRDQARVVFDTLATLDVGEAWVLAQEPAMLERKRFPLIRTLDTSATPKAGETRIAPKVLAEIDLSGLRDALAAAAPVKADKAKAAPLDVTERSTIWNKAWAGGDADGYKRGREDGYASGLADGDRTGRAKERARIMTGIEAVMRAEPTATVEVGQVEAPTRQVRPEVRTVTPSPAAGQSSTTECMAPTATAILKVIQSVHPRGISFAAAATRAGASKKSSQYRIYRKQIMESGHVTGDENRLVAVAGNGAPLTLADWMTSLPPSQAAMLEVLRNADGPMDRIELGTRAGISLSSSGLGSGIRELLNLELITETGGVYRLAEELQ